MKNKYLRQTMFQSKFHSPQKISPLDLKLQYASYMPVKALKIPTLGITFWLKVCNAIDKI